MVEGGDISNYQGLEVDWHAVARHWSFAWVLITDGEQFVNPQAHDQIGGLLDAGVTVGGYHFARPSAGAAGDQAARFIDHCPPGLVLPPMLDSETSWLGDPDQNAQWVLDWFDHVSPPLRVWYSNRDGVNRHVRSVTLQRAAVRLFLAAPGQSDMTGAGAWGQADVVQYGTQAVDGFTGTVDVDRMTDELWTLIHGQAKETDDMPLFIVKGDQAGEWWLTDGLSKRYIDTPAEAQHWINVVTFSHGIIEPANLDSGPLTWPQGIVDLIPRTDVAPAGTPGTVDVAALASDVAVELGKRLANG